MNIVGISGNLVRDAEARTTKTGEEIATFTVAVNERVKVDGEWTDYANFIDCKLFNAGKRLPYLKKGAKVTVGGKIHQDRWEKDGKKFSKNLVIVNDLDLPRKDVIEASTSMKGPEISLYDADIPF